MKPSMWTRTFKHIKTKKEKREKSSSEWWNSIRTVFKSKLKMANTRAKAWLNMNSCLIRRSLKASKIRIRIHHPCLRNLF